MRDALRSGLSLGPRRRLQKRQDYLRIQSQGRKVRTPHLLLAFILLDEASAPHRGLKELDSRIGVTITRKIDKRAVVRNRLRRRIKETFRLERGNFVAPVEMVVVALNGANELEFKDLRGEFLSLLRKAKILPNKQW